MTAVVRPFTPADADHVVELSLAASTSRSSPPAAIRDARRHDARTSEPFTGCPQIWYAKLL